jgi:hypothetical protein
VNVLLWVLQGLLALHTAMGAVWKCSNSEQNAPSLHAIPHVVWLALIGVELLCAAALIAPALRRSMAVAAPVAAACIAAEMLLFSAVHLASGDANHGPMIYWLVVAAVCAFVSYGRFVLKPL